MCSDRSPCLIVGAFRARRIEWYLDGVRGRECACSFAISRRGVDLPTVDAMTAWCATGQAVVTAAGGRGDWADLYSAVDSTRRMCIFHRDVLLRGCHLEGAVGLLSSAVGNLRSTMVRNALLGVSDMFR